MGCCFSQPAGPNAPYPGGSAASPSARPINAPPPLQPSATDDSASASPRGASHPQQHPAHRERRRSQQPLSQHIDKPLRRQEWVSQDRPWTWTALDTERADFFHTRVTGRPEVWQVLRAALEVMWEAGAGRAAGAGQEDGEAGALATAQSILRAAEVTLPTGNLANGVYDSLGNYYALPEWVVSDPVNVAEDSGRQSTKAVADRKDDQGLTGGEDATEEVDEEEEALRRREEKGKAIADTKNMVKVRARLSESGRDVTVKVGAEESVRGVARRIAEVSNLSSTKRIRVAYMGKILKENTTLEAQGWQKGHIVNALVFSR